MTTYYPFSPTVPAPISQVPSTFVPLNPLGINPVAIPPSNGPFTFQPDLDGTQYTITVTWSLFGQRYYANCYTLEGTLIFSLPLIGSDIGVPIQNISWISGTVTVTTNLPHGFKVGSVVNATISGVSPDSYNGTYPVVVINSTQFTYQLSSYPGSVSSYGTASYDINMAAGYFNSSLVYRTKNQQFEVFP